MAEQIKVKSGDRVEIQVTDWRYLVREMRKIDVGIVEKFKKNATRIGRPVQRKIQSAIPARFPITGMEPKVVPGRMTWGAVVPAKKTDLKVDTRMRKKGKSIVSVWVQSPAMAMADVAKNVGKRDGRLTNFYEYSGAPEGYRQHKVNGQGSGMVKALNKARGFVKNSPSRVVWPAGEKAIPEVNIEMNILLEQYATNFNAEIQRNA